MEHHDTRRDAVNALAVHVEVASDPTTAVADRTEAVAEDAELCLNPSPPDWN